MAIIGISGKIGSGKDTAGKIIQYITSKKFTRLYTEHTVKEFNEFLNSRYVPTQNHWQIVKFADALKDIVCILTGCTREQLEDADFKNSHVPEEHRIWYYVSIAGDKSNLYATEEEARDTCPPVLHMVKSYLPTYREFLVYIGTDLFRNKVHPNIWVNALMNKYKGVKQTTFNKDAPIYRIPTEEDEVKYGRVEVIYPNWVITDVRFPNEAKAIKDRGGIVIRINRFYSGQVRKIGDTIRTGSVSTTPVEIDHSSPHPSETALDNYDFDYVIDNNDTIKILIGQIKEVLIKEKLL